MKEKTLLLIDFNDIGSNIRLLRFAKSFLSLDQNKVISIGNEQTPFPSDLLNHPNFFHKDTASLFHFNEIADFLFAPISFIFHIIKAFLIFRLYKFNMLFCSANLLELMFASIISIWFNVPLIVDVQDEKNSFFSQIFIKFANLRIGATKSISSSFMAEGLPALTIHSYSGLNFVNNSNQKTTILNSLDFPSSNILIGISAYCYESLIQYEINDIISKTISEHSNFSFIIFTPIKSIQQTYSYFSTNSNHVKIFPINFTTYPQYLGSCDLGICLDNHAFMDFFSSNIPIFSVPCSSSQEFSGKTSFVTFESSQELIKLISQCSIFGSNCNYITFDREFNGVYRYCTSKL